MATPVRGRGYTFGRGLPRNTNAFQSSMRVFTYGSLMYRQVWDRVVSGAHEAENGTIRGYARRRILSEVYPALLRGPSESTVRGVLYLDVSASDLAALDRFEGEGDAYLRIQVPVELDDGKLLNAWTYLYLHPERVEGSLWDAERFEAEDLHHFLNTYCRDRAP